MTTLITFIYLHYKAYFSFSLSFIAILPLKPSTKWMKHQTGLNNDMKKIFLLWKSNHQIFVKKSKINDKLRNDKSTHNKS